MVAVAEKPRRPTPREREVLTDLAGRVAEIAALPAHETTQEAWIRLNGAHPGRPLVWIDGVPWSEMNAGDELTCRCDDPFLRRAEWTLRSILYAWSHMPADMVVEDRYFSPLAAEHGGFGLAAREEPAPRGQAGPTRYLPQIHSLADVERIRVPEVQCDDTASDVAFARLQDAIGGVLPVERRGIARPWFAPWDELVRWYGVDEMREDLERRPELLHAAMDRLVNAFLGQLRQYEELNVLSMNNGNLRTGTGGLGYTDELPAAEFNPARVRPVDLWGCAIASRFEGLPPTAREAFALPYERRWLEQFGLVYYDGGEAEDCAFDALNSVPNLRKIAVGPRTDLERAVAASAGRHVLSFKADAACLAAAAWDPEAARTALRRALERMRGCAVEVVLDNITTVRGDPRRLWAWARMAAEVAAEFG